MTIVVEAGISKDICTFRAARKWKGGPLAATDDKLMARLLQIRDRQEALIRAVDGQTDCIGILDAKLSELLEWANKPPSGTLEEALQKVADALLIAIDKRLAALPEQVAAAVAAQLR